MVRSGNKIGILGGCFDPLHIGHLILAEFALEEFNLNKILFIPNKIPPHKKPSRASPRHRYNMVKLAIQNNPKFEVSDIEIKRRGISYSYQTLLQLRKKFKEAKFYFILGSDAFNELTSWKNFPVLIKLTEFIVATRPQAKIEKIPKARFRKLAIPEIRISSSFIRDRIKKNLDIQYLVPNRVREYIKEYNLYR